MCAMVECSQLGTASLLWVGRPRSLEETGDLEGMRSMSAERIDEYVEHAERCGLVQGMGRERALSTHQAGREFGAEVGVCLAKLLAGVDDLDRLDEIGERATDCATRAKFLTCVEGCPRISAVKLFYSN